MVNNNTNVFSFHISHNEQKEEKVGIEMEKHKKIVDIYTLSETYDIWFVLLEITNVNRYCKLTLKVRT